jgi:CyaY protein
MQNPIEKIEDSEFKEFANLAIDKVEQALEKLFETTDFDVDTERQGSNVLNIKFPNNTVIVINLQTPLHELWLAAKEGGYHFRWAGTKINPLWLDTKTNEEFFTAVSRHISKQGGVQLTIK